MSPGGSSRSASATSCRTSSRALRPQDFDAQHVGCEPQGLFVPSFATSPRSSSCGASATSSRTSSGGT
eukprot:7851187-Alexandrium_andersonii.AAC.1